LTKRRLTTGSLVDHNNHSDDPARDEFSGLASAIPCVKLLSLRPRPMFHLCVYALRANQSARPITTIRRGQLSPNGAVGAVRPASFLHHARLDLGCSAHSWDPAAGSSWRVGSSVRSSRATTPSG